MFDLDWNIDFISKEDFKYHVCETIKHYGDKLESYDVKKFNRNLIDPIKMVFDKAVYGSDWKTIIDNEIFRQRDKSNSNEIGYFHQKLFSYIEHCRVPENGKEGGWDVIVDVPNGYVLENGNVVHTIFVEVKNKHNTMNSPAAGKTYIKMQNQLLKNDDCACFLVEVIASHSQNKIWKTTVDKQRVSHTNIRRVSIDKFYEIVTGDKEAFFKICMVLPFVVDEVLNEENHEVLAPKDVVYDQMIDKTKELTNVNEKDDVMLLSMYMLGFSEYEGFKNYLKGGNEL